MFAIKRWISAIQKGDTTTQKCPKCEVDPTKLGIELVQMPGISNGCWLPDGAGSQAIQRHLRYVAHVPWGAGVINKLWIYVAIDSIDKMNKIECILYISIYCIITSITYISFAILQS